MQKVRLWLFVLVAAPIQVLFLAAHFLLSASRPADALLHEALPVLYLAVTYLQWLLFAFVISFRTRRYRVPLTMHLPHLLSFLPLLRHIMIAANRGTMDSAGLTLAWIHSVVTHCFSLVAAWLWQMRGEFDDAGFLRQKIVPVAAYAFAALTTIVLYAGLDFSFAATEFPLSVGIVQLALNTVVTVLLMRGGWHSWLALCAAVAFALVDALLLFDRARADIGVEAALAAGSFTQIFSLYVLLLAGHRRHSSHSPA